ncbi:MAG: hypothetical protein ACYS0D_08520 [Planctomycetota bacterium]|jgi:hypothetical protein
MSVLVSHINEEAQVASVLKEWIESSLDRDVHASGEARNIQLDKKRLAEVDRALSEAQVVLLLCSERSIGRPWISFESGCAWFKRVPVMAVCHGGCSPDDLPPPLGSFPAFDLTDVASCQALLKTLATHLKRKRVPRIDCNVMIAELEAAMDPSHVPEPRAARSNDVAEPVATRPRDVPEPAPAPRTSDETHKSIEVGVLATIKRLPEFTCTAPGLAEGLGEQERRVRHALEKLVNNQLLTLQASTHPTDPETRYALTEKGRKYFAKHNW